MPLHPYDRLAGERLLRACLTSCRMHGPAQVFVANPNKTLPVMQILVNNKQKLLDYLAVFHTDKGTWPLWPPLSSTHTGCTQLFWKGIWRLLLNLC